MNNKFTAKQYLGALIYDVSRAIKTSGHSDLQRGKIPWVNMHNRDQSLTNNPHGIGVACDWVWTSDLYLPKIFPAYGRWLYRRTLKDFPISLKEKPKPETTVDPQVSFIIGHRGEERLPLLLTTIKSIASQAECRFECIVIEQDSKQVVKDKLPDWVHYIHTPLPKADMPYSRSWSFNVGAKEAKSGFLIFHDNDMLVPEVYAKELLKYHEQGFEFINLKRFIFYHDKSSSEKITQTECLDGEPNIEEIVQNLEAGGSFGADRQAYQDIGGFDERFVGWGGEDNEFWERANTRKVYPYGYLPIVHLWHEPQAGKREVGGLGRDTFAYAAERQKLSPVKRIEELNRKKKEF